MTVGEWIRDAASRLESAGIESAPLEAQVLCSHALGVERSWAVANPDFSLEPSAAEELLLRRLLREPLAYIVGRREFYGRRFRVTRDVLIPRQETETLVDAALGALPPKEKISVLDLGTGSGCLAITLALERPAWRVAASDVSEPALQVARRNSDELGADVRFVPSDLCEGLMGEAFDAIVTNPPYVPEGADLQPEVRDWEPGVALFAGESGLEILARIASEAAGLLRPGALLITEIGNGQAQNVREIYARRGWIEIGARRDLSGTERALLFRASHPA